MITTKSPIQVLKMAYEIGREVLRKYSHRCSPKTFTQPQLFACLVLKEFLKLDYRGLAAMISDVCELRSVIELRKSPHFTTYSRYQKMGVVCDQKKARPEESETRRKRDRQS